MSAFDQIFKTKRELDSDLSNTIKQYMTDDEVFSNNVLAVISKDGRAKNILWLMQALLEHEYKDFENTVKMLYSYEWDGKFGYSSLRDVPPPQRLKIIKDLKNYFKFESEVYALCKDEKTLKLCLGSSVTYESLKKYVDSSYNQKDILFKIKRELKAAEQKLKNDVFKAIGEQKFKREMESLMAGRQ